MLSVFSGYDSFNGDFKGVLNSVFPILKKLGNNVFLPDSSPWDLYSVHIYLTNKNMQLIWWEKGK